MKTRIQKEIKQWREIKNDEFRELIKEVKYKGVIPCTDKESELKMILDPEPLNKSIRNFCMKDIMFYINYREKELINFLIKLIKN